VLSHSTDWGGFLPLCRSGVQPRLGGKRGSSPHCRQKEKIGRNSSHPNENCSFGKGGSLLREGRCRRAALPHESGEVAVSVVVNNTNMKVLTFCKPEISFCGLSARTGGKIIGGTIQKTDTLCFLVDQAIVESLLSAYPQMSKSLVRIAARDMTLNAPPRNARRTH